jgi:hypothetical protein
MQQVCCTIISSLHVCLHLAIEEDVTDAASLPTALTDAAGVLHNHFMSSCLFAFGNRRRRDTPCQQHWQMQQACCTICFMCVCSFVSLRVDLDRWHTASPASSIHGCSRYVVQSFHVSLFVCWEARGDVTGTATNVSSAHSCSR